MKKMYFAMVPEGGSFDDILTVIGVGAAVYLGAKYLLGDEKINEYKKKIKDLNLLGSQSNKPAGHGPDTGMGINDEDARAKDEETILERIRKAAQKI